MLNITMNEAEPPADGYYVTFWSRSGNPWVFLHQVVVDTERGGHRIYMDHVGGGYKFDRTAPGDFLGWLPIDRANDAVAAVRAFYDERKNRKGT